MGNKLKVAGVPFLSVLINNLNRKVKFIKKISLCSQ
jgi:hypothetical protein